MLHVVNLQALDCCRKRKKTYDSLYERMCVYPACHPSLTLLPLQSLVITEDSEASLKAILTHSLFKSESELQEQLNSIPGKKGTKILIWNIRRYYQQLSC